MLRKIIIGTVATAAMVVGSVTLITGPAAAGISASNFARDYDNTPLGSFSFNHVLDSLTVCDLLDDGRQAHGKVTSVEEVAPDVFREVVHITLVDSTPDGNCVTASKDIVEGTPLTVRVLMQWSDGSSASFSAGAWAVA